MRTHMPKDPDARIDEFKADMAAMKLTTGRPSMEQLAERLGALAMVVGIVLAVVGYSSSLNVTATPGSNIDLLHSNSDQILAVIGLAVAVCGGLVYLRFALVRFLRLWLLRQVYEQRRAAEVADGGPAGP